ncbi:MAG: Uma2 family endonuclease [Hydrococcus sp. Prado102]|jgi:Uma2 family endonuclease|nr:Uma2 family endonuclease [Hydrococcus sp. Prado102]
MLLELRKLNIPPGDRILLTDISWQEYEQILEELGEHRAAKLSYSNGILEIMTPLFIHENATALIGDFVKILLDELDIDYELSRSTTFKNRQMNQGVEPDESFYIKNCLAIRGKERIDLTIDPPPDLAIEIDITSRIQLDNYRLLGVPELWRYNGKRLQINILQDDRYIESQVSSIFPDLELIREIPQRLEQSKQIGSARILKEFRIWVKKVIR